MPSEFALKNAQEEEFVLEHPDNAGAVRIKSNEIATKLELAAKVALASFIGTNQSLSENGYQKLPGGLIIQWGKALSNGTYTGNVTFPISFPTGILSVVLSQLNAPSVVADYGTFSQGINGFSYRTTRTDVNAFWLAIGY